MTQTAFRIMILLGSALMVYNIGRWFGFAKKMRWIDRSTRVHRALYLPAVLLISFLLGYLGVAIFGRPELLVALILFGGSIFVFIILRVLYFIVDKVMTSQEALLEEKQASAAKTQFFSNISHDLRTPLNAIIGYTQLGLREGTQQEEMHSYLDKINASGRHLLSLIDDVLEMSRIENGKMELRPEKTDLCKLLCDARDLFDVQMRSKGIAVALLTDAGFAVDTAENGQVALGMLTAAPAGAYDAVLMDIQMPVMDGVTASKAIRALADPALSSIPIVAMTANVFGEDLEREREAGMTAHISKPLHVEQMLSTLAEVLG